MALAPPGLLLPLNDPNFDFRSILNSRRDFPCIVHGFLPNNPETYGSIEEAHSATPTSRLRLLFTVNAGRLSVAGVKVTVQYYHGTLPVTTNTFTQGNRDVTAAVFLFETGTGAGYDNSGNARYQLDTFNYTKLHGRSKRLKDPQEVKAYRTGPDLNNTMKLNLVTWGSTVEDPWPVHNLIRTGGFAGPGSETARLISRLRAQVRQEMTVYIRLNRNNPNDFSNMETCTFKPLLKHLHERQPPLYPYHPTLLNLGLQDYRIFRGGMLDTRGVANEPNVQLLPLMSNRVDPRPLVVASSIGEIREQQLLEISLRRYVQNIHMKLLLVHASTGILRQGTSQLSVAEPQDVGLYLGHVAFPQNRPHTLASRMPIPSDGTVFGVRFGANNNAFGRVVRDIKPASHQGTNADFVMLMYLQAGQKSLAAPDVSSATAWYGGGLVRIVNRLPLNQNLEALSQLGSPPNTPAKSLQRVFMATSGIYTRDQSTVHLGPSPPSDPTQRSQRQLAWQNVADAIATWPLMNPVPPLSIVARHFVTRAPAAIEGRFCGGQASMSSLSLRAIAANIMVMLGIHHKVMVIMGERRDIPDFCSKLNIAMTYARRLGRDDNARAQVDWNRIAGRITKYTASPLEHKGDTASTGWRHVEDDPFHPIRRRLSLYFDWALEDLPEQAILTGAGSVPDAWSMRSRVQELMRPQIAAPRVQQYFQTRANVLDSGPFVQPEGPQRSTFDAQGTREAVKGAILRQSTDLLITDCRTVASDLVANNFRASVVVMIGADRVTLAEGLGALLRQDYQAVFVHGDRADRRYGFREAASHGENEAWSTWYTSFWVHAGYTNSVHLL